MNIKQYREEDVHIVEHGPIRLSMRVTLERAREEWYDCDVLDVDRMRALRERYEALEAKILICGVEASSGSESLRTGHAENGVCISDARSARKASRGSSAPPAQISFAGAAPSRDERQVIPYSGGNKVATNARAINGGAARQNLRPMRQRPTTRAGRAGHHGNCEECGLPLRHPRPGVKLHFECLLARVGRGDPEAINELGAQN